MLVWEAKLWRKKLIFFFDIGCLSGFKDSKVFDSGSLFQIHHKIAHGMLGCVLNEIYNISINKIIIKKSKYGKPFFFFFNSNIKINISHSGDIVVVAISDREIGVDVQRVEPIENDVFCYLDFFTADEMKYIDSFLKKSDIFTVFWTRKEAILKRFGLRICDGLKCSCFSQKTRSFLLNSLRGQKYAFSYSFSGSVVNIYRYDCSSLDKFFEAYEHIRNV